MQDWLALMLVGALIYAFAQGPGYGPGAGKMGRGDWGYQKGLNLTPDQKAKFQELRRKFNDETTQLRETLLAKRAELRSLWTDPKADSKTIMEKERELRDPQDQMRDKMVQMRLEGRNILTPEQLAQIGQDRGKGPGFGRGHMMGPGGMKGHGQRGGQCGGM